MFSAIKRFTSKGDFTTGNAVQCRPPSHQTMSSSLQKKFAKGVQYNMKIVIKGDRNVGKTCLFHRLQGKKFLEEYIPTEEIQVTSIQWNYKATDDIVKVEVWDVVDRGKKKKRFQGLKLDNTQVELPEETALDAEFLDVYKGTNGVIMMMDLTKTWTFDYVQRELPKIPSHIPIIVLANHCDMAHHRTVTSDHVIYYTESVAGSRSAQVRYAESSMRNGFGLKLLHKFFNLPFLQLQKEALLGQLERNELETMATVQELDIYCESDEANYNKFLDNLVKKRRENAELNANIINTAHSVCFSTSSQGISNSSQLISDMKRSQSASFLIGAGKPIQYENMNLHNQTIKKSENPLMPKSLSHSSGIVSKFIGDQGVLGNLVEQKQLEVNPITSVDEFCPDGGQLDKSFLEDVQIGNQNNNKLEENESDSDTNTGNPLVSELQEDFEPEEIVSHRLKNGINFEIIINTNAKFVKSEDSSEPDQHKTIPDKYDMKQTNDEFDSTINSEISELTSDAFDTWMGTDTKWRRSPEGEDASVISLTLDCSNSTAYDDSMTSSNVHMELLSLKHSQSPITQSANSDNEEIYTSSSIKKGQKTIEENWPDKKEKHKKLSSHGKEKYKELSKEDKKSKRRSRDESSFHKDELEEFLNGTSSPPIDGAYEAI